MNAEINLNYSKWHFQGNDIDMFEIMSMIILYSRCDFKKRMDFLFILYCQNDSQKMSRQEFKFMLNKLGCAIGTTYQIKKSFLHDLIEGVDQKFITKGDSIVMEDFSSQMSKIFQEINFDEEKFN